MDDAQNRQEEENTPDLTERFARIDFQANNTNDAQNIQDNIMNDAQFELEVVNDTQAHQNDTSLANQEDNLRLPDDLLSWDIISKVFLFLDIVLTSFRWEYICGLLKP